MWRQFFKKILLSGVHYGLLQYWHNIYSFLTKASGSFEKRDLFFVSRHFSMNRTWEPPFKLLVTFATKWLTLFLPNTFTIMYSFFDISGLLFNFCLSSSICPSSSESVWTSLYPTLLLWAIFNNCWEQAFQETNYSFPVMAVVKFL